MIYGITDDDDLGVQASTQRDPTQRDPTQRDPTQRDPRQSNEANKYTPNSESLKEKEDRDDDEVLALLKGKPEREKITVSPELPTRIDPTGLASNVIELSEEQVEQLKSRIAQCKTEYIEFFIEMLGQMFGLEQAMEHSKVLISDGLRLEVETDSSLSTIMKWQLQRQAAQFFADRLGIQNNQKLDEHFADLLKAEIIRPLSTESKNVGIVRSIARMSGRSEKKSE